MKSTSTAGRRHEPWNKGKLVGQKLPPKRKDIWGLLRWRLLRWRPLRSDLFN